MDGFDIIGVVAVILFSLVYTMVKGKNTKAKGKSVQNLPKTGKKPAQASVGPEKRKAVVKAEAAQPPAEKKPDIGFEGAGEGEDPCHEEMLSQRPPQMRYQNSDEATMAAAGEGEDPCHVGNSESMTGHIDYIGSGVQNDDARQEVLRQAAQAVLMGEVLKRPSQRREERRMHRHRKAVYGG